MKMNTSIQKHLLATLAFLFICSSMNAQAWTGNTTTDPSIRFGNTGIGLFDPTGPQAALHLREGPLTIERSLLRFQVPDKSSFATHVWDTNVFSNGSYNLDYGPNGSSFTTRLTLLRSGKMGLSVPDPLYMLHANGSGKFNGSLFVEERMGIGTDSPSQLLTVSSPSDPIIRLERSEGQNHDWEIYSKSGGGLYFRGGGNGSGESGTYGWGNKMAITSSGRVGIGLDGLPPDIDNSKGQPFMLYVKNGVMTEEVKVEIGWCDYVFEKDYNLLPLESVEKHIETKGYLHNTPSGKTIEEDGLDLGAMTANQQEKIEELFLHVIELNKRLKSLEAENKELKAQQNKQ